MHKILTERASSMQIHPGFSKCFWAYAVHTSSYLINPRPSSLLTFGISEEIWSGKEVILSHLRVFGCIYYVHISDHVRDKLDAKKKNTQETTSC